MQLSQSGLDFIAQIEGFSATPYNDPPGSAKWSIGYGHQIQPGENLTSVTEDHARNILAADTANANAAVSKYVTAPLTQAQHDALVSFVFNIGVGAFVAGTVPTKLNNGDFQAAADTMRQYDKSGGVVNTALVSRREDEASNFDVA